ncbi:kanamycin kinase [Saccharomonospora piscinae]|uniref:Kanamycin kinase n=1 Tax=Saccharomonospora piscinae TaxID=687388 RepID=A0A1V8ZXS1_SACPI|nr:ROK family protein [Saccharomonospora piscinae]OQO89672.1 kanamycin kinase [Saccharomonospora piscinae]
MSVLGIDIGGTKVALRAEADGVEPNQLTFRWSPRATASDDLARLAAGVAQLVRDLPTAIRSVGVAVPATVDERGRVAVWPSRPSWNGLDLGAALRSTFPDAVVRWADDGDLAAVAEAEAIGERDLLYIGVGTGIGGGIVLGGRSVPGPGRGSCELGHVVVDSAGPRCACGRTGCLQAIASGSATLRRATSARGLPVSFSDLREGVLAGSPWAVTVVDESCLALATAVASVNELVRPDCAVLGGGFAADLPGFVDGVEGHLRRLARPGHPVPALLPSVLGGLSSLHGAIALAAPGGGAGGR